MVSYDAFNVDALNNIVACCESFRAATPGNPTS
jgi:hypothetical protein